MRTQSRMPINQFDFDCPWVVDELSVTDGKVMFAESSIYAPEAVVYEDSLGESQFEVTSDEWEALSGYTGQYSYNGPIMHASEFIGGGMEQDLLKQPGTYVTVAVLDMDTAEGEDNIVGWAVLRKVK